VTPFARSLTGLDKYRSTPLPTGWPSQLRTLAVPVDQVNAALTALLSSAATSIRMAMYSFTDIALADILAAKAHAGVTVQVSLDSTEMTQPDQATVLTVLQTAGAATSVGTSEHNAYMHLKDFVIDSAVAVTGSVNLSHSGQYQQDNRLVVIRSPVVAAEIEARVNAVYTYQTSKETHP